MDNNEQVSILAEQVLFRLEREEKLAAWRKAGEKCQCGKPIEYWEFLYRDKCRECRTESA